jgi:single-strand DNA-binding protein
MDINNLTIVGRLTKDEELSYTTAGVAVGKFSIACNRLKDKDGTVPVDFFDVVCFGKQAENLKPYLVKGKQVAIQGRIQQERWQGKDGNNYSKVSIIAENVQLIGGVRTENMSSYNQSNLDNENIPF